MVMIDKDPDNRVQVQITDKKAKRSKTISVYNHDYDTITANIKNFLEQLINYEKVVLVCIGGKEQNEKRIK